MADYKTIKERCGRISVWELAREKKLSARELLRLGRISTSWIADNRTWEQEVYLTHSKTNFGGIRVWFACPSCDRRVGCLYLPPAFNKWACRHCHGIVYRCQRLRRDWGYENLGRYDDKQKRIQAKMRNKYLRTATKVRLLAKFKLLENAAAKKLNDDLLKRIKK